MTEYPVRLTKWLQREDLLDIIKTLNRHHEAYKIKEGVRREGNRKVNGYAIYIKERRQKERRRPTKLEDIDLNMTLDRFILLFLTSKREGISLFKAVSSGSFF